MLNLTTLLDPEPPGADDLRYGTRRPAGARRPAVAWTVTRSCNLACRHCYSASINHRYPGELSDDEARAFVDDLVAMPASALLLTGGEPTLHPELPRLARRASGGGLRVALSTNGTRCADETYADRIAESGLEHVGISFDGTGAVHDDFRGVDGAFASALRGARNLRERGVRVGLRMTLTAHAVGHLDQVLDLVDAEGFTRACFYHFVPSGRGVAEGALAPDPATTRATVDRLIAYADRMRTERPELEVLTVANAADGARVLTWLEEQARPSEQAHRRLARAGGNRSGAAIAHVSGTGDVHPDQFSWGVKVGSVRERPFSELWADETGLLGQLRDRIPRLTGRCAACRFLDVCGGNLRARARAVTGDAWASDPSCYLTERETAA